MAAFGTMTSSASSAPGWRSHHLHRRFGISSCWDMTPSSTKRELRPDLRLLVGGEDVDDPVDRLHRAVRVQGAEGEVARLGDRQRRLDRLEVAHLADQHDVGVLTEDVLERALEALGVRPDLALVHDAVLVLVQVLDRILDRDDVLALLGVDLVDDRRERRALPEPVGPVTRTRPRGGRRAR
jgi:hypothetical protein